jgi:hypothetical protein
MGRERFVDKTRPRETVPYSSRLPNAGRHHAILRKVLSRKAA